MTKKNLVFPIIVLACSILDILQSALGTPNWLALINSFIGIGGSLLFFFKNENYRKLINTWIYLQAIVITKTILGTAEPIFDLTQFFHLKLGFSIGLDETSYSINFNFLALIYFVAFKKLQINELIGKQLILQLYRNNEVLNSVLPQAITVEEKINFTGSDNWLLSRLSKPIELNDKIYEYCLIKSKDDIPIVPNKKSQMAHLRLVEDVGLMKVAPLNDNVFVDWVFVS